MSLFPRPILINGATHSAQQFRLLVRDLARDAEGITRGTDLKVTQRSTPGAGVTVADGSAVIKGRVNTYQGHYAACNTGAFDVDIASTGGSPRSDMLVLRVEDPDYEGSVNPATGDVAYFQVISNVSSSATTIPDSRTAIPLARIDIPASTSTITNAMITDLRSLANPRRFRDQFVHSPASASTAINNSNSVYSYFSTEAGWTIPVPSWASTAIVTIDIAQLKYTTAAFYGVLRATFGASLTLQAVTLDDNQTSTRRATMFVSDKLTIPDAYRGTSQLLRPQAAGATGNTGTVQVDGSSTLRYDIEFIEAPR